MNDFDAIMRSAWRRERPHAGLAATLPAQIRRHRLRHRLLRGMEVALTAAAIAMVVPLLSGSAVTPNHWLVLPFFAVYLPAAWWLLLRATPGRSADARLDVRSYAHVRISQLRRALHALWFARRGALALMAYAVIALAATLVLARGELAWIAPAATLLAYALAWAAATHWLSGRKQRRYLREYRVMRQLTGERD